MKKINLTLLGQLDDFGLVHHGGCCVDFVFHVVNVNFVFFPTERNAFDCTRHHVAGFAFVQGGAECTVQQGWQHNETVVPIGPGKKRMNEMPKEKNGDQKTQSLSEKTQSFVRKHNRCQKKHNRLSKKHKQLSKKHNQLSKITQSFVDDNNKKKPSSTYVLVPPPQCKSHVDQFVHAVTVQSQVRVLHGTDCANAGQAAPPSFLGVVTFRVRVLEPVLQTSVQLDHALEINHIEKKKALVLVLLVLVFTHPTNI